MAGAPIASTAPAGPGSWPSPSAAARYEPGHRTVALVGRWRHAGGWPLADPSHTLLESYEDGWAWSVPLDERSTGRSP